MKKVIIVWLVFLSAIASFLYAFVQQTAATRARREAESNANAAIEARAIADENAVLAKNETICASMFRDSLKNCKGR